MDNKGMGDSCRNGNRPTEMRLMEGKRYRYESLEKWQGHEM